MDAADFSPAEDQQSPLEKLSKYSGLVPWSYLAPHYKTGSLLYVDPSVALKQVGLALAEDNTAQVQAWRRTGLLVQPCDLHCQHWQATQTQFNAMIVRPFVLAQAVPQSDTASVKVD